MEGRGEGVISSCRAPLINLFCNCRCCQCCCCCCCLLLLVRLSWTIFMSGGSRAKVRRRWPANDPSGRGVLETNRRHLLSISFLSLSFFLSLSVAFVSHFHPDNSLQVAFPFQFKSGGEAFSLSLSLCLCLFFSHSLCCCLVLIWFVAVVVSFGFVGPVELVQFN